MVYPHILMRDYARQTIEYISLSKDISNINLEKIRPPYKSNWYKRIFEFKYRRLHKIFKKQIR